MTTRRITEAEYHGAMIYSEAIHDGKNEGDGGFFDDIDDLVERCLDYDLDLPAEVNGCLLRDFRMDAARIMDGACEDAFDNHDTYEDARSDVGDAELAALQAFLDTWIKTCGIRPWYSPDEGTVIVIDPDTRADFDKRRAELAAETAADKIVNDAYKDHEGP